MAPGSDVNRIVADTDALLFWGGSRFLDSLFTNVGITTTKACVSELARHARAGEDGRFGTATLDGDERRRKRSAENVLPYVDPNRTHPPGIGADDVTITTAFCGTAGLARRKGGGEESIARLVSQRPGAVEVVAMMDSGRNEQYHERGGRELVRETVPEWDSRRLSFVSPASVLGLLAVQGLASQPELCADLASLIDHEGWPDAAWRNVPLDCPQGPDFLPETFG